MSWNYVIVGAGSAGAVLAARLTEDPSISVLLLEAGPDFRSADTPPAFQTRDTDMTMERNGAFWWPDVAARRNPVQEPYRYLCGRGVGGSSTVNGLCAIRGMPEDYDRWARLGAKGWSFDNLLPVFMKLEDEHDFPDDAYHGRGGPVPVYREPEAGWSKLDLAFREAVADAGHPWCADHNAPDATGVSPFAMHIRDGRRVSANDGYLEPARHRRPNLTIRGDCQVDKLLISGRSDAPTVRGILLTTGDLVEIEAGAEVIIACGAVHSPTLLMRSGIGPAAELTKLDIDVIADLPVGCGLQDHAMLLVEIPAVENARRSLDNRVTNCVLRYASGLGGTRTNDMMLLANTGGRRAHSLLVAQQEQVFSRGRLTLLSRDPTVGPLIEQCLLTDERDLVRMQDALDRMAALLSHRVFTAILTERPELPAKEDLCRIVTDTAHLAGSCRMGAPEDEGTVVDPDCRVLGVEGLRVIDASIMPSLPRANIYLTVVMIAEVMAMRMAGAASNPALQTSSPVDSDRALPVSGISSRAID